MLVFVLVTMLGTNVISTYDFKSIDECLYFSTRVNGQVMIPRPGEQQPQRLISYCKPVRKNK